MYSKVFLFAIISLIVSFNADAWSWGSNHYNWKKTKGSHTFKQCYTWKNWRTCSGHVNKRPIAKPSLVKTYQNQTVAFRLKGFDADGDALTYRILAGPWNGEIVQSNNRVSYSPKPNFWGKDYIKFRVSDGRSYSDAWVKILIKRRLVVNNPPVAQDDQIETLESKSISYELQASDQDNDELRYSIKSYPENGTLDVSTLPTVIYTPDEGFVGKDEIVFLVTDGKSDSVQGHIEIFVQDASSCDANSSEQITFSRFEDISRIQLNGVTKDLTPNPRGALSLTNSLHQRGSAFLKNPIPLVSSNGEFDASFSTSFSFKISNPSGISDRDGVGADGLVFVVQTNSAEVGASGGGIGYEGIRRSLGIEFDTWNNGKYDQNDGNHIALNLDGSLRSIKQVPVDSRLNSGGRWYVWIDYDGVSDRIEVRISTTDQRPEDALLAKSNVDLTQILRRPEAFVGFTSGTGAAGGWHDVLDFEFSNRLNNNNCENTAPTAENVSVLTDEDETINFTLNADDEDGDTLSFELLTDASNGIVSLNGNQVSYQPNANFFGSDLITYRVFDGELYSQEAQINIQVSPVNDIPTAQGNAYSLNEDTSVTLTLVGEDVDEDPLNYIIVSDPVNGTLSGSSANLTYSPNENFNGVDQFSFRVSDGTAESSIATISIEVLPINDRPLATSAALVSQEDVALSLLLSGSDLDGDELTYTIVTQPNSGQISGQGASRIYTPLPDFDGVDAFQYMVNDGELDSEIATIEIRINPVNDVPNAEDITIRTDEDTTVSFELLANDVELSPLQFQLNSQPNNGVLTGTPPNISYTPNADYTGLDSFEYVVSDGELLSEIASVFITILPINDAPIANNQSLVLDEDTFIDLVLTGSDVDSPNLSYTIDAQPNNGSLSGTAPNLRYSPNSDFNGSDSFTFNLYDGELVSNTATVELLVNAVNDAPIAQNLSVETEEDIAVGITLIGSDADNESLQFELTRQPANGTVSGSVPNLSYTPNANYTGIDSFDYTVNDGQLNSSVATVSVTISAVNDSPFAESQSLTVDEDTSVNITLSGSDIDSDNIIFSVAATPSNGSLVGDVPNLSYTPNADFSGTDSFTFTVTDGELVSNVATVHLNINPINDPPRAADLFVETNEDTSASIDLLGSDVDSTQLVYELVGQPSRGTLSGSLPNLVYTPETNYFGTDYFQYTVSDGLLLSAVATVSINIKEVNDQPSAENQNVVVVEDGSVDIVLTGEDSDEDALTYTLLSQPTNGQLNGQVPNLRYSPKPNYIGSDSFTYTVSDGSLNSNIATVSISVTPENDAPVAYDQQVGTNEDTPVTILLEGLDLEQDPLSFAIETQPTNGIITGELPNLVYTPDEGFSGQDSFKFVANDAASSSFPATVSIQVIPVNDAPEGEDQFLSTPESTPLDILLSASDLDGDSLAFSVDIAPSNGQLSGQAPNLVYTPNQDFFGDDSFTYVVDDGATQSLPAQVSISVIKADDGARPDLRVELVESSLVLTDPQSLVTTGSIGVTVNNAGERGVSTSFSVLAFYDVDLNGQFDSLTDKELGSTRIDQPLGAGQDVDRVVNISGYLAFRDAPIHVFVDSLAEVDESDEENNTAFSLCEITETRCAEGVLGTPELKFAWDGSVSTLPKFNQVTMLPVVGQANDDNGDGVINEQDVPDIFFTASSAATASGGNATGYIRIISGADGSEIRTFTSAGLVVEAYASLALGDIDNDGEVEVLAAGFTSGVYAFELDGALKWHQPNTPQIRYGGITLADLNGDGQVEILAAGAALSSQGDVLWQSDIFEGQFGTGSSVSYRGTVPITADIDLDGVQEVIYGGTAFGFNGDTIWQNANARDGLNALGNFDQDDNPEFVVVKNGLIVLVDHDGQTIWVRNTINGEGGAPTVADFDGDGKPEIGIAGSTAYAVYETDGSLLWQAATFDTSSRSTGSSVFDFDNDGIPEVVYADEINIHIFLGTTGESLFKLPHSSATTYEYPVVVDIDNDGSAEIVVPRNDLFRPGPTPGHGIRVYEERDDLWVGTRSIWNQHAYSINNINDDGTVPANPESSWLAHNTFRLNAFPECAALDNEFEPVVKWEWLGAEVLMSPVSAQTTDDNNDGRIDSSDTPDVMINAAGVLHILDGDTGLELASNLTVGLGIFSNFAVGDIDGDNFVEIVSITATGGLVAYNHDATVLWHSPNLLSKTIGAPALADIDGDGTPEIIFDRSVINADGTLRWTGSGDFVGRNQLARIDDSVGIVADIDPSQPGQEVIFGASAYAADGTLLWQNDTAGDGFTAVADFDADGTPEIVKVFAGSVSMLDNQGQLIWGPNPVPGMVFGGSPTIGDVNGDGTPEIGVGGSTQYSVINADGSILWQSPIVDASSAATGSTVFDFNNDGKVEIIFVDEQKLRIYAGSTGSVLFEAPNSSRTAFEYPVVVDLDSDFHAELIVPNSQGVTVYEGTKDDWASSRQIWNQHAYSIDNINDDGTVPAQPGKSWLSHNTYRLNNIIQIDQDQEVATPIKLTDFELFEVIRAGRPVIPIWTLSDDNESVYVSTNASPTFFYSQEDYSDVKIRGTLLTTDRRDGDWMGFVWGFQNTQQFYQFIWDNENCGCMRIDLVDAEEPLVELDPTGITLLAQNDIPWERNVEYTYELLSSRVDPRLSSTKATLFWIDLSSMMIPISMVGSAFIMPLNRMSNIQPQ